MPEIFLQHSNGDKARKWLRVAPNRDLFVIGSSKEADLRIHGEGVGGCHAALRYRAPHWYLCDLSGTESVRVNDEVVTEARIDETAKVEIAGHRIQLFTKERNQDLFPETSKSRDLALHQVVVRSRSGRVIETRVLKAKEAFRYNDGDKTTTYPAPTTGEWVKTEAGVRMIQQRLVGRQELIASEELRFDRDLKKPFVMAMALLAFFFGAVALISFTASKNPEVVLDQKSMDIIFNAKIVEKKKVESKKMVKAAKARAGGSTQNANAPVAMRSQPDESQAPKSSAKPSAALTSIRQAGLSNLIGKIAKRANKQGVMVAAVGVSPDAQGSGRAIFSTGTSLNGGGGGAVKEGPTYRLGGIATRGKAGGMGNVKDGTALAGGSIGTGDIVAMVDEETVIEGGLDRDAIAEVIRRNLGQIRYCYERQLSSNPDLYGKVLVRFTIGAGGEVAASKVDNSTLKSDLVEGCILRRMASWKFPLPKGGTQVNVSYPFLFKALN